jgi:hypothetical protein
MEQTRHRSPAYVTQRVTTRAVRYFTRDPLPLLVLALLGALLVFGLPGILSSAEASALPADGAEQYLRALKERNPDALYESLSPELRKKLESTSGRSGIAAAATLMQQQAARGDRVLSYRLIGRYDTVQGERLRFYVVQFENNGQRQDVPYTMTLGPDGVLTKVE